MRSKENPNVTLAAFVNRMRDDASRFQVLYERAQREQPGLLTDERTMRGWARYFIEFLRAELGFKRTTAKRDKTAPPAPRPKSRETTVFFNRSRSHRIT